MLTTVSVYFTDTHILINTKPSVPSYIKVVVIPSGEEVKQVNVYFVSETNRITEEVDDEDLFTGLTLSLRGEGSFLNRVRTYMNSLDSDVLAVVTQEYSRRLSDCTLLEGFVAGLGSYIAFLALLENGAFVGRLPFEFHLPTSLSSGNATNENMFRYISLPLTALRKTLKGSLLQMTTFLEMFINLWAPLFRTGPLIPVQAETRCCIEIVSGISTHFVESANESQVLKYRLSILEDKLTSLEEKLATKKC